MGGNWQGKLKEIKELKIEEFALFLSCLDKFQRNKCYRELLKLKSDLNFKIPFVHARSDMHECEYEFLMANFSTEKFNLHPVREFPLHLKLSKRIRKFIYIENATEDMIISKEDLTGFAGICFDLSHLKDLQLNSDKDYQDLINLTNSFKVGANHISGVGEIFTGGEKKIISKHYINEPSEVNYLSTLNSNSFSELMAIELENTIFEQLCLIPLIKKHLAQAIKESSRLAA